MRMVEKLEESRKKVNLYLDYNEHVNRFLLRRFIKPNPVNDQQMINKLLNLLKLITVNKNHIIDALWNHYNFSNDVDFRKDILEIQETIKQNVERISKFVTNKEDRKYLEYPTKSYLSYNSITDQFEVITNLGLSLDDDPVETLRYLIEITYWDMIFYVVTVIPSDRFGVCPRCGGLKFASTRKPKVYCGFKCTKAVAQVNYIEKKRLKK